MKNKIHITFDNEDQATRYFKNFKGINGANQIQLINQSDNKIITELGVFDSWEDYAIFLNKKLMELVDKKIINIQDIKNDA